MSEQRRRWWDVGPWANRILGPLEASKTYTLYSTGPPSGAGALGRCPCSSPSPTPLLASALERACMFEFTCVKA